MPILPPISPQNYDTVTHVLNSARRRLNDVLKTLEPVSGKLLGETHEGSQQTVNSAWRNLQDRLADRGYARLISEVIIQSFPVVGSLEPSTQCWLSWAGCFDGVSFWPQPALPADFTHPLKMWERQHGTNAAFSDPPMEKMLDGLPCYGKSARSRVWEWRSDAIWTVGSQLVEDFRIRYVKFLEDFEDVGEARWYTLPVPIMRGSDALSWYICAEVMNSRGDTDAAQLCIDKGDAALNHLFNLDVAADQRVNIQRRARSGRAYGRSWF